MDAVFLHTNNKPRLEELSLNHNPQENEVQNEDNMILIIENITATIVPITVINVDVTTSPSRKF